jgi:nucleoside-triphosphatase THEP1
MRLAERAVVILSGPGQSGKTTLLAALVNRLRREGLKVAGILAEGLWETGIRSGFDLTDLSDSSSTPLCRRRADNGPQSGIPFDFFEDGFAAGIKALSPERCAGADVVVVDEIGFLELDGKGWSPVLRPLLELDGAVHVWVVRHKLLEAVRAVWGLATAQVVTVEGPDALNRLKTACLSGLDKLQNGNRKGKTVSWNL